MSMFRKTVVFGSTTVGERGQIVLPVKLRKMYGLKPGDTLIVLSMSRRRSRHGPILLVNENQLKRIMEHYDERQRAIRAIITKGKAKKKKGK